MPKLQSWKAIESKFAKYFGTKRKILSGSNSRGSRSDSTHRRLFLECKNPEMQALVLKAEQLSSLAKKHNKIVALCFNSKADGSNNWIAVHQDDLVAVGLQRLKAVESYGDKTYVWPGGNYMSAVGFFTVEPDRLLTDGISFDHLGNIWPMHRDYARSAAITLAEESLELATKESKTLVVGIRIKFKTLGRTGRPGLWLILRRDDLLLVARERLRVMGRESMSLRYTNAHKKYVRRLSRAIKKSA